MQFTDGHKIIFQFIAKNDNKKFGELSYDLPVHNPQPYQDAYDLCKKTFGHVDLSNHVHEKLLVTAAYAWSEPKEWRHLSADDQYAIVKMKKINIQKHNDNAYMQEWFVDLLGDASIGMATLSAIFTMAKVPTTPAAALVTAVTGAGALLADKFADNPISFDYQDIAALNDEFISNHLDLLVDSSLSTQANTALIDRIQKMTANASEEKVAALKMSIESLKKQQEEKLKAFADAYQVKLDGLSKEAKEKLSKILSALEQQERQRDFAMKVQAAKQAFEDISSLGRDLGIKDLMKVGTVGQNAVKIGESLVKLQDTFPIFKSLMDSSSAFGAVFSGLAQVQPYIAIAAAAVQIGMALFSKPKEDPFAKNVMLYLKEILKEIQTLRKEMHDRFDKLDEKMADLLNKVDQVYLALKDVIQANHELTLTNLAHVYEGLGEDIQHVRNIIETLTRQQHLDELNAILVEIDAHKQGKTVADTEKAKLDDLLKKVRLLSENWLLKNLVSPGYNGGIYSHDSSRQNGHFIGNAIKHPKTALGFLYDFVKAENKLNLAFEFSEVNDKLPLVDLWAHGVHAFILATEMATQKYGAPFDVDGINEFNAIAQNTIAFVNTLKRNHVAIYTGLSAQYKAAMLTLKKSLTRELAGKIKSSEQFYTVTDAIEKNLLDLKIAAKVEDGFIDKIKAYPDAREKSIPLIFFLAQKLGLINFSGSCDLQRIIGGGAGGGSGARRKHVYVKLTYISANVAIQFGYTITSGAIANMLSIKSEKPPKIHRDEVRREYYDRTIAKYNRIAAEENSTTTDLQLVKDSVINQITVDTSIKATLNDAILDKLAEMIIEKKQSGADFKVLFGEALGKICDDIYANAVKAVQLDKATNDHAIDSLKVTRGMMIAYAQVMGLPVAVSTAINENRITDVEYILKHPEVFNQIDDHSNAILSEVVANVAGANSPIHAQMAATLQTLDKYTVTWHLYHGYQANLKQWQDDTEVLKQLQQKHIEMQSINNSQANYFDQKSLDALELQYKQQFDSLKAARESLLKMSAQLTQLGFSVEIPNTMEDIFTRSTFNANVQSGTIENFPLRRGKQAVLGDIKRKSIIDIIQSSNNPLADVTMRLEDMKIDDAIKLVRFIDSNGATALHYAAKIVDLPLIKLLVKFGANIVHEDHLNKKPLDYLPLKAKEARTFLMSSENWQVEAQDLNFSLPRAIALIREGLEHISKFSSSDKSVGWCKGKSGGAKTTSINFMHGTDYDLITDETGACFLKPKAGTVLEVGATGSQSTSVTQMPSVYPVDDAIYIDMPGDGDTGGVEVDIRNTIVTALLAKKFSKTKAIEIFVANDYVYDVKFEAMRETLRPIGLMIAKNPKELSKHLLLTITKLHHDRFANVQKDPIKYETMIYKRLEKWFQEEIQYKTDPADPDYPIKLVLENLKEDNVIILDPLYSNLRQRYKNRVSGLPEIATHNFDFMAANRVLEVFKHFIGKLDQHYQVLDKNIAMTLSALGYHWQQALVQDTACYQSNLDKFSHEPLLHDLQNFERQNLMQHDRLNGLIDQLKLVLKNKSTSDHGIVGDTQEITEKLSHLIEEFQQVESLIYEPAQIAVDIGFPVSENLKRLIVSRQVKKTLMKNCEDVGYTSCDDASDPSENPTQSEVPAQCTSSSWPLPGGCAQIIGERVESLPNSASSSTDNYFTRSYGSIFEDYLQSSSTQLVFLQWFINTWVNPYLPSNQMRKLTSADLKMLQDFDERFSKLLCRYYKLDKNGLEQEILQWVQNTINKLGEVISNLLDPKQDLKVTTTSLNEIRSKLDRVDEQLTKLAACSAKDSSASDAGDFRCAVSTVQAGYFPNWNMLAGAQSQSRVQQQTRLSSRALPK